jgi:hypothetical protein
MASDLIDVSMLLDLVRGWSKFLYSCKSLIDVLNDTLERKKGHTHACVATKKDVGKVKVIVSRRGV